MAILNNSNAISAGGYDINNSLRFRSSASAYLSRTPASAGNTKKWTWSAWIKLGAVSANEYFFSAGTNANGVFIDGTYGGFGIDGFYNGTRVQRYTTALYRDPSAWYHVVAVVDTTQAVDADRLKMYVNGNQVALSVVGTGTYPALNSDGVINSAVAHSIGRRQNIPDLYFDGYMTEVNFIDGQALTPSSFGETDTTTGVWKPKAYSGTYGTNGFYLKFSDIATTSGSNAGLGKDFSGNSNYWTTNNISVTAGTTYDAMTDVPTLTSATVANYSVLNAVWKGSSATITDGNLACSSNGNIAISTIPMSSGKWYCEWTQTNSTTNIVGIIPSTQAPTIGYPGQVAGTYGYSSSGSKYSNGSSSYGATWTTNDVIGIAYDASAGTLTFYKNGVSQGNAWTGLSGEFVFAVGNNAGSATTGVFNFGQRPFSYTPPTGYVALNTYNLPTPTILKGNKYMDATTYTGNGSTQTITNAGGFKPDLVWVKDRSFARSNYLTNSVVGTTLYLSSDQAAAEVTATTAVTSLNSNGFSIGSNSNFNTNAETFVGWQWQAGQGSTSSNTSGSITSTVSVNTTAGFSVVTYTGNGTAGATVGHGLGVSPAMTIIKSRLIAGNSWCVWQKSFSTTQTLYLESTTALLTRDRMTGVSSTTFTIGSHTEVNTNASTYVAYCFAEISGYSKFGSYTGNGSADGPFVYTGFRPKFVLVKCSSAAGGSWVMYDTSRNQYNLSAAKLAANLSEEENGATVGGSTLGIDVLANGFKHRNDGGANHNASGATYIFAAFAENPFKNSLAR